MNYLQSIEYLESFKRFGIHLGLGRIRNLLSSLGNPHKKFKSIHIAGTNGKGSVCAILSSILNAEGYKVGLYTSPHLVDYTERIRIKEKDIDQKRFAKAVDAVKKAVNRSHIKGLTEFELLTAVAFLIFAQEKVDVAVVETGMGGRLDATNVVVPLASVVTNVELEHTEILGKTVARIAKEKAGIIKRKVPVVTWENKKEALSVIRKACVVQKASLININKSSGVKIANFQDKGKNGSKFDLAWRLGKIKGVVFSLNGRAQIRNLETALAVLVLMSKTLPINKDALARGLSKVNWPARLQTISRDIMVDSAHNPSGAKFLRHYLVSLKKKITFIIGMQNDKDFVEFIDILAPVAKMFIVTRSSHSDARDPSEFVRHIRARKKEVRVGSSVGSSLRMAKEFAGGIICITGSIYLVGDYLKYRRAETN
ncbi:bifunctional folylpolyglutamate synthase/dihydrofolate synthase [Candidatus Margulisiibacteriota bacterium]